MVVSVEKVGYDSVGADSKLFLNVVSVAKPPWSEKRHNGKLERMILQLGAGHGRFSEVEGIPRSIGCIGNNSFILRREPLSVERMKELVSEFKQAGGKELWLTNYDSVEQLVHMATYAVEIGVPEVYAVVLLDDIDSVSPVEGVKFVCEFEYSPENMRDLETLGWVHAALITVDGASLREVTDIKTSFLGEVYLDVLFPGSARELDFNVTELRRIINPSVERYHDCLAGTVAISADGYALPCPLLRNYVVADVKSEGVRDVLRKRYLKRFWKMTKAEIEGCAECPFRYVCHDCRALEYQATGDIHGIEFCIMPF